MGIRHCPHCEQRRGQYQATPQLDLTRKREKIQKIIDEIAKKSTLENLKENLETELNNLFNKDKKNLKEIPCPPEKLPKCKQLEDCPVNPVFVSCQLLSIFNESLIERFENSTLEVDTETIGCVTEPFCISNSRPIKTPCDEIDTSIVYAVRAIGELTFRRSSTAIFKDSPFCKTVYTEETVSSIDQIVNLSLDPNVGCPEITVFLPQVSFHDVCDDNIFLTTVVTAVLFFGPLP
ncbi:ATP synthase subunit B family protein [Lysinibacillus xylanilyticus]|uniref:hypothetical protein n=1 Tax=Lysinibacillus xylanilyticus TaxID=582475 RepID=UPI003823F713